jgi:hypothetical protein
VLTGALAFYTVANGIATAIDAALVGTVGGRPQRVSVVPGAIAHDACDCGALYVSPGDFFLSDDFPQGGLGAGTRESPCELAWAVSRITIELMRCAPQPIGNATAPTVQALDNAARIYVSDAYVVRRTTLAYLCGLKSSDDIIDFALGDQSRNGPAGGCVGTTLTAYVSLPRD